MRSFVARFDDGALAAAQLVVRREERGGDDAVALMRHPVIVEVHHGNLLGERQQRTDVVAVIVRRPQVIDSRHAGRRERLENAAEIAVAGVAGVDEQRLARGADEERRLPALGVDVVDAQCARTGLRHQAGEPGGEAQAGDDDCAHIVFHSFVIAPSTRRQMPRGLASCSSAGSDDCGKF